jgi:hypothetical protein
MSQQDWTSATTGSALHDHAVTAASVTCHVVKLKGLPFSARQGDIVNFFSEGGFHISETAVVMYALRRGFRTLHANSPPPPHNLQIVKSTRPASGRGFS